MKVFLKKIMRQTKRSLIYNNTRNKKHNQLPESLREITLIGPNELASALGVSVSFIYKEIGRGNLNVTRLSKKLLKFRIKDVSSYIETRTTRSRQIEDLVEDLQNGRRKLRKK